jgi:hypothetical protein
MTVYIVRATDKDLYKVGYTSGGVATRLDQLQTGCPYKLEVYRVLKNGGRGLEEILLGKLSGYGSGGGSEWYEIEQEKLDELLSEFWDSDDDKSVNKNPDRDFIRREPSENIENEIADVMYELQEVGKIRERIEKHKGRGEKTKVIEFDKPIILEGKALENLESLCEEYDLTDNEGVELMMVKGFEMMYFKRLMYLQDIAYYRDVAKIERTRRIKIHSGIRK